MVSLPDRAWREGVVSPGATPTAGVGVGVVVGSVDAADVDEGGASVNGGDEVVVVVAVVVVAVVVVAVVVVPSIVLGTTGGSVDCNNDDDDGCNNDDDVRVGTGDWAMPASPSRLSQYSYDREEGREGKVQEIQE